MPSSESGPLLTGAELLESFVRGLAERMLMYALGYAYFPRWVVDYLPLAEWTGPQLWLTVAAYVIGLGFIDASFESMSGFTTTGATIFQDFGRYSHGIFFWRGFTQWLGGMGIIVLSLAILPFLGVGGMQLFSAESPGPVVDKLTPRITETAKALWYVYLAFTIACFASYMVAGMGWFDALCHAFSTVAIGGFSTHDLSIGYFDSAAIDLVAIVFMFFAGINFSLHFYAWRYVSVKHYGQDPEFRAYTFILVVISIMVVAALLYYGTFAAPGDSIVNGLFQAVSIATTTGFTTTDFTAWPTAIPVLLIFASFIGGSAGSTAGGIKVIRWLLVYKQGMREIVRLVHPSAEIPVKLGNKAVPYRVVDAVWGFFSIYVIVFAAMMLAMMATGLDQVTAFSAVAACLLFFPPRAMSSNATVTMNSTNPPMIWPCRSRCVAFTDCPRSGFSHE